MVKASECFGKFVVHTLNITLAYIEKKKQTYTHTHARNHLIHLFIFL